jgi:hypothetical protein
MSHAVTQTQSSLSDMRWWKDHRSTSEMAEYLAQSHVDKQALECQVAELQEENRLLKSELAEAMEKQRQNTGVGRREAEAAARERLLKDEFERKVESIQVDLNRIRQRAVKQVEEMKAKMAGCICGEIRIEHEADQQHSEPSSLPKRWAIRNSK